MLMGACLPSIASDTAEANTPAGTSTRAMSPPHAEFGFNYFVSAVPVEGARGCGLQDVRAGVAHQVEKAKSAIGRRRLLQVRCPGTSIQRTVRLASTFV